MGQLQPGTISTSQRPSKHAANSSQNGKREYSYGLHSRCSAVTGSCVPFPRMSDCTKDPSFCNMWRTVGFLISFGVVVELCTIVSLIIIMAGGVQRRAAGWQVAVGVLAFSATVQCAGMAIVVCSHHLHRLHSVTVCAHADRLGLPLRPQRAILERLAFRSLLVSLYRELDHHDAYCAGNRSIRPLPSRRGRLRTYSRRVLCRTR